MNRQKTNKKILKKISEYIENYPDMRFCQALINLGINDLVFEEKSETMFIRDNSEEESKVTLGRIKHKEKIENF